MALGTCFPAPVSLKKVLKESSPPLIFFSVGTCPSGWIPCSRQYSSQHALPIWAPAWPTWMEIHSRCRERATRFNYQKCLYTFHIPVMQKVFNHCNHIITQLCSSQKSRFDVQYLTHINLIFEQIQYISQSFRYALVYTCLTIVVLFSNV